MESLFYSQAVRVACSLALLSLVTGCDVSISLDSPQQDVTAELPQQPTLPQLEKTPNPNPLPKTAPESSKNILTSRLQSSNKTLKQGTLRIANKTNQPVRLALLARSPKKNSSSVSAHWDFDPQEGSEKGLILSLPNGKLKLEPGDVLVAFAQDGSRRYWGPYVVGESDKPTFQADLSEWRLTLQ